MKSKQYFSNFDQETAAWSESDLQYVSASDEREVTNEIMQQRQYGNYGSNSIARWNSNLDE